MNITKYCICILQLKYVSFLVSLTILSFSDCCQLLGKELGRERLLPYCSRGQWVWDWNICDWCLGQDHHGGHAQPSSPPSSPTRLKALEMLKPHQDLFFFLILPIAGFLSRGEPRVSELQHIPSPIKLAGTTPEPLNPLFSYLTVLWRSIQPLFSSIFTVFKWTTLPTLLVTHGLWHQKTKKNSAKLKLSYVALQLGTSGTYWSKDHTSQNPQHNI